MRHKIITSKLHELSMVALEQYVYFTLISLDKYSIQQDRPEQKIAQYFVYLFTELLLIDFFLVWFIILEHFQVSEHSAVCECCIKGLIPADKFNQSVTFLVTGTCIFIAVQIAQIAQIANPIQIRMGNLTNLGINKELQPTSSGEQQQNFFFKISM